MLNAVLIHGFCTIGRETVRHVGRCIGHHVFFVFSRSNFGRMIAELVMWRRVTEFAKMKKMQGDALQLKYLNIIKCETIKLLMSNSSQSTLLGRASTNDVKGSCPKRMTLTGTVPRNANKHVQM